jgi:uncharacterized protein (DUF58 family)
MLNLNAEDYFYRSRIDSAELAIVIAASISNWVTEKKQMVGIAVNGRDPLAADGRLQTIPPRKGKRHLMRLLETLARAEMTNETSFVPLIQEQRYQLAWGTTLIVITGSADDKLLGELYQARRWGQNAVLILAGRDSLDEAARLRANVFGIAFHSITSENDLKVWMRDSRRA